METNKNKPAYDLEERLIEFAVLSTEIVEEIPETRVGSHLGNQLLRSGTSPALNYGEAQGAESANDFIHKMGVCLKELKESRVCLKIILRKKWPAVIDKAVAALKEAEELVAIFSKSIQTARNNKKK